MHPSEPSQAQWLGARTRINMAQQRLWLDGRALQLRPKAWQALTYLLQRPEQLISSDALLDALWPGQEVSAKTLVNLVSELRTALGDKEPPHRVLQTVHRRGYRLLVSPVRDDAQGGSTPPSRAALPAQPPLPPPAQQPRLAHSPRSSREPEPHPRAPGELTLWVGRESESAALRSLLDQAVAGQRHLALVAGPSGVGKTALLDRFTGPLAPAGVVAARGACLEQTTEREPFAAVLALLADLCSGPLAPQAQAALRRCAPTWLAQLPWLVEPEAWAWLQKTLPGSGQGRMLREFVALLQALSGPEHPALVLVLEDLHWADHATLDLLQTLASQRAAARLLVVGSYQPALAAHTNHRIADLATQLVARQEAVELQLQPLSGADIRDWMGRRLGNPALGEALKNWAESQSMGIPLYLQAAVRYLIDTGAMVQQQGQWTLVALPPHSSLPDPLRRLINARMARLAPETRELLEAASLVGMKAPLQLLAATLERDTSELEQLCHTALKQVDFAEIGPSTPWPDGTQAGVLQFTHDIYRRALYESLSPGWRQRRYRLLAERLEAGWKDQPARVAGQLATAYAGAGMPEATARVLEMTAHLAAQRLSYSTTIEALNDCLLALQQSPAASGREATELRVQLMLGNMCLNHHGVTDQRTLAAFERASTLAQSMGAQREQIRAQLGLTIGRAASFQPSCAVLAQETVTLAEAHHTSLRAAAHHYAGIAMVLVGELAQALWHQDQALQLPPDPLVPMYMDLASSALIHRGRTLCWMGHVDEGLASIEAGIARCREVSIPVDLVQKLYWAGDALRTLGLPRAEALLTEVHAKAELFDLPGLRAAASAGLACSPPPAERDTALIDTLTPAYCRAGDQLAAFTVGLALAEAHLAQGRWDQAHAAWQRCRAVTPSGTFLDTEVLRLQSALVRARGGAAAEAQAHTQAALALARRHRAGFYALRCAADALVSADAKSKPAARAELAEVLRTLPPSTQCVEQQRARQLIAG
jgi:DNA-binding winged helix-turn-helix (wHTH) protein/tetratricopeptide (TPR) repeat protein